MSKQKIETVTIGSVHQVNKRMMPCSVEKMMADFPTKELFDDNCPEYTAIDRVRKWYKDKFGIPKTTSEKILCKHEGTRCIECQQQFNKDYQDCTKNR